MVEKAIAGAVSDSMKWVAVRVLSGLSAFSQGRQSRLNLDADVAAIDQLQEKGLSIARYSGLSMDVEAFARAVEEEDERRATNVVNALQQADSVVDWEKVDLDKFNPEFAYRWGSEASNVSDETLQNLWARLMKGELESPGSVSNDTMTVARDMTKARAEEFQILCSTAFYLDDEFPWIVPSLGSAGSNSLLDFGLPFNVLVKLAHHRLIVGELETFIEIPLQSLRDGIHIYHQEKLWIIQANPSAKLNDPYRLSSVLFTPAGEELFRIVQRVRTPSYTDAMRKYFLDQGIRVSIATSG